ncbi:ATP-binding protein [Terasakiella sp. SH-1]|uniref:ATP-binding protein n=1 Tax=Terasakiella sp. SH-1 TaxID=2560057 RepID=UPI0010748817|nr:ATP-binding protein [Terasakiella sp. SH-1]
MGPLGKRIFLFITLCIFVADACFVLINYYQDKTSLQRELELKSRQLQLGFEVAMSMTTKNMLQLATFVANDVGVRRQFAHAAQAHRDEGGGKGGPLSAHYRVKLYDQVASSWEKMSEQFYVRQLHFHLPPDDTSFLRVHRLAKWGDDLSPLRYMIVDTMKDHQPREGLELGRIYAGIRGAVPVFAPTEGGFDGQFLGVLEAGTSYSEIIDTLKQQVGTDIAILLNGERVSKVKWQNGLGGAHAEECGCFIEASSDDTLREILPTMNLARYRSDEPFTLRTDIVEWNGRRFALTNFGIRDYIGDKEHAAAPVGRIAMWSDVEEKFVALALNTQINVVYAIFGFLLIEALILFGMRFALGQLRTEVERQSGEINGLLREVTVQKDKAVSASQAKSEFLANMSHELRTPMMGIRGILDLLKSDDKLPKESQTLLSDLDASAQSLIHIVDDVLDLSKIEAGKLTVEQVAAEPSALVMDVAHVFQSVAQKKQLSFITNAEEHTGFWCLTDPVRFKQIVTNLVNNALKFTSQGAVAITMERGEKDGVPYLNLHVRDSGIGMDKKQVDKIFERFMQADTSTTRQYGGTGLGLTISHQLAVLLGGTLSVTSEKGVGSTFTLTLPVEETAPDRMPVDVRKALSDKDILLAEDNLINQKVVVAMLEKHNHRVVLANNGQEAVELASKQKFDVILMDMQMPVMDGLEATDQIRKGYGPNKNTLIFAFTADAVREHRDKYLDGGVNDVVTKPINLEQLEEKIRRCVDCGLTAPECRHKQHENCKEFQTAQ